MHFIVVLLALINGYKTYASVILMIVSGLGMILSKDYHGGLASLFQALTLIFGGASVASLRHAIDKSSPSQFMFRHDPF